MKENSITNAHSQGPNLSLFGGGHAIDSFLLLRIPWIWEIAITNDFEDSHGHTGASRI